MKALRYILSGAVIVAVIGLMCYQTFVEKNLDSGNITRGLLIIAGAVISMVKPPRQRTVMNKKALYQKAYPEFILDNFSDDPKLQKTFYQAVDDYNRNKSSAAIAKLIKLRQLCQRSSDMYSVTAFTALCMDDLSQHQEAIKLYDAALKIRDSSTLHSNMGLCYQKIGDFQNAEECYHRAARSDPQNNFAWNNLGALYFRKGNYETALEYVEKAIALDAKMPQALSNAAIFSYLLGDKEKYEKYYRQAVANGYDGKKIKYAIQSIDPEP